MAGRDKTPEGAEELARRIVAHARAAGLMIATAESCTGGLVAAALTDVPGASEVFERGFVTYSNRAKEDMLGVPGRMIDEVGAVSAETAAAMAEGALARSRADVAVAITGIAGPGGGSAAKPVGLVHFALAARDGTVNRIERRFGDPGRAQVRDAALRQALTMLLHVVQARAEGPQSA